MRLSRCSYIHIVLSLLVIASCTTAGYSQTPRFGVKHISTLPNVKDVIPHAINRRGEIVGEITFTDNQRTTRIS